jgi:hypothetical protein
VAVNIEDVSINGKNFNLQLLQLMPSHITASIQTLDLQLTTSADSKVDKVEPVLQSFFSGLLTLKGLKLTLSGHQEKTRALASCILGDFLPSTKVKSLETIIISQNDDVYKFLDSKTVERFHSGFLAHQNNLIQICLPGAGLSAQTLVNLIDSLPVSCRSTLKKIDLSGNGMESSD